MTFYIYTDNDGLWRWYFEIEEGRKIAESSRSYETEEACRDAIAALQSSIVADVVSLV